MSQQQEIERIYSELDEARQQQLAEDAARLLRQQQDETYTAWAESLPDGP